MKSQKTATFYAILAAALYAINIPFSKKLLTAVEPTMMAAFLYLGAGVGLLLYGLFSGETNAGGSLTRKELPYTIGMIVLDIAAPIFMMRGLTLTNSANASLLNNFEIVATSIIAWAVFREVLSRQLLISIALVTVGSMILGFEGKSSFQFNVGSLYVLAATCYWGLENNCTRKLSGKSSVQITTIKGLCCGVGSFCMGLLTGEHIPDALLILVVMLLGFVAYGLSINFYIKAQKELGAAKTSAYYSIAPFLGVVFAMVLLGERPGLPFYVGLLFMVVATVLMIRDSIALQHTHVHTHVHCHEHRHGDLVHTHQHTHTHEHSHIHGADESCHSHTHSDLEDHHHHHEETTPTRNITEAE